MSAITFTQLPPPGATERLRQAFVGYNNLPQGIGKQPLRFYIHDDGGNLRLRVNEFQTLVNCLPMATVCSEARSHAIDFCRKQVAIVDIHYTMESSDVGDEIREHTLQPTTVMVTNANRPEDGPRGFDSADQDYTFIDDPTHARYTVFMKPDRTVHVKEKLFNEDDDSEFGLEELSYQLLKFHEILDACKQKQKLLHLRSFELQLHTYCWDEILLTRVRATVKDGALWVNWSDFQSGFNHDFFTDEEGW
ncbi:hypothetical protein N0V90_013174 [Kalmusia sp. IMI 367209]|nr:hypothetical protein N0V90_013174 [Kalmusia sp. IMI 367209]